MRALLATVVIGVVLCAALWYSSLGFAGGLVGLLIGAILGTLSLKKAHCSTTRTVLCVGSAVLFTCCLYYSRSTVPSSSHAVQGASAQSSSSDAVPTADSSDAVQGVSANWLLAQQLNKHNDAVRELTKAKDEGDMAVFESILRVRSRELADVIDKVERGSYSISDKAKMLRVFEQEKEWADSSIAAIPR